MGGSSEMRVNGSSCHTGSGAESDLLDSLTWAFEEAWALARRGGPWPKPTAYVPPALGPESRRMAERQLAVIDLEHRLRLGGLIRVEDYFDFFPEMRADESAVRELVRVEFRHSPSPLPIYERRFPHACNSAFVRELAGERSQMAMNQGDESLPRPMLPAGTTLEDGNLRIRERIGAGMGEVYLAWHEIAKAQVVVKVSRQAEMEARFQHEIELHHRLGSHPQIVAAKNAGRFNDRFYLTMEYVPGMDLGRYVAVHGPIPYSEASKYVHSTALGLAHCARQGRHPPRHQAVQLDPLRS